MSSRREFLKAGGLALAGLAVPAPWLVRGQVDPVPMRRRGAGRPVTIRMRSDGGGAHVWFDPIGVHVPPGATVRWVLEANVHSATAYHPANGGYASRIPPRAEPWDSGLLTTPGQAFAVRLDEPGVYDYFCIPHELAGMAGRIVVAPAEARLADLASHPPVTGELRPPSAAALAALPEVAKILALGRVSPAP